jgi:GntR family transcriptional regulator
MDSTKVGPFQFQLDFSQPIYEQILEQIRSSIAKGEIGLGEKIPSVRELAHGLKVNPNTVMRAYQELERDGLTEKRRGQGTYTTGSRTRVNEFTIKLAEETIEEFLKKMESIGYTWDDIQTCIRKKKGENR